MTLYSQKISFDFEKVELLLDYNKTLFYVPAQLPWSCTKRRWKSVRRRTMRSLVKMPRRLPTPRKWVNIYSNEACFWLQARQDYKNAYISCLSSPSTAALAAYFDAHNAYVVQLHATNGILEQFGSNTLPSLLQVLNEYSK